MSSPHELSDEEIERFVERGVLLLRGCFSPEAAAPFVRASLVDRAPAPVLGRGPTETQAEVSEFDFFDSSTWQGRNRLDLSTGRVLSIADFAPRLFGALRSLIGPRHRITRRTIGEQWIIMGRSLADEVREVSDPTYVHKFGWHIDTPGPRTTLEDRYDALVLLILWSDVEPMGGGPLYSGESLAHLVAALEAHPEGLDTRDRAQILEVVRPCADIRELTGSVGDVLITHPLALHAAHINRTDTLRILENPTITVAEPLRYYTDVRDPSPVERAVIRRLSRPRPRPRDDAQEAARYLVEHHPDYFLPGRAAWSARMDDSEREVVHALDALVTRHFVTRAEREVERASADPIQRVEAALALLRPLFANQRAVKGELRESGHDADFSATTAARLLRGFVNCEGQSHALGLILARSFETVHLFDAIDAETRRSPHALLLVRGAAGAFFADAWATHGLFHVASRAEPPHPGTPELGALRVTPGDDAPPLSRGHYERGAVLSPAIALPAPPSFDALARGRAAPPPALGVWQDFLRIRAQHVLYGAEGIAAAYAELEARRGFGGLTRDLVKALATALRRAP